MKKVLFIYKNRNLAAQFVKHFKLNGYNVIEFYDEEIPYRQYNYFQRLENIFYRLFFNNKKQIHKIDDRNFRLHSNKKLNQLKAKKLQFDFCFVVRGDLIPKNVLTYARTVSGKMIDYQLDGLSVSSKILDYKSLFDQIYVFDEQDLIDYPGYGLKATTNCYFENHCLVEKDIDFSYIGVDTGNRFKTLEKLYTDLRRINPQYNISFNLKQNEFAPKQSDLLNILSSSFSYEQCLNLSNHSKILVDLKRKEHDGLSLRFFEAMTYKNKIITNNSSAKNYDFYHPDNVFVTDFDNLEGLKEFITKPFYELPHHLKEKYNFKNWIKALFNI